MLFHSRVLFSLLRLVPFGSVLRFNSFTLSVIARQTCVCFMSGLYTHFTYIHFSGGMKLSACDVLLNSLFNSLSPAFDFWQHESESAKLPTHTERDERKTERDEHTNQTENEYAIRYKWMENVCKILCWALFVSQFTVSCALLHSAPRLRPHATHIAQTHTFHPSHKQ